MTVLVTGGAGYIGGQMVYALIDAGERVVVLDNLSTGHRWAVAASVPLVVGESGDQPLVSRLIREHDVEAIIHFAASLIVPDSVCDPLGDYRNNTVNSRALIECAIESDVRHFIFSSTAAVYGNRPTIPADEEAPAQPISPYGWSELMTEIMLRDASRAHDLRHVALRYFNIAGADPQARTGQSSKAATHLIKVAAEAALGLRPKLDVFGIDYPTPDGTCIRDYIHVSDLVGAHLHALRYLRSEGPSLTLNCGYGQRLFGSRSDQHGQTRLRRRFRDRARRAARGRSRLHRRGRRAPAHRAWLAAALRRSFADRDPCARLGAPPLGTVPTRR